MVENDLKWLIFKESNTIEKCLCKLVKDVNIKEIN